MADPLRARLPSDDRFNPWDCQRSPTIQAADNRMRMACPHHARVQHPAQVQIGDKLGLADYFFIPIHTGLRFTHLVQDDLQIARLHYGSFSLS